MKKLVSLIVLVFCLYGKAQVNITQGLTACFALNANAMDAISNLSGTLTAITPTVDRFNNANSALYFNGTSGNYVALPETTFLKPANALSFSCWIKTPVLTDQYILFTRNSMNSFFEAYNLCIEPGLHFMTRKGGPSGVNMVLSTTTLVTNTWYHLVTTIDNSAVKLYVNGVLEGTTAATYNGFDYVNGKKVFLGTSNETMYDAPFKGTMDNIRFYNRTLNAAEVAYLYNQDPACGVGSPVPVSSFSMSGPYCVGQAIHFTDLSTNTPNAWNWQTPGAAGASASVSNPTVVYNSPGTYTVSLTASNGSGMGNTASQTLTINPNPTITASASRTILCVPEDNVTILTASGASTYTWSNSQTGASITLTLFLPNNVTYTVIGANLNGCKGSATVFLNVFGCHGINESDQTLFSVYPNPANDFLILSLKNKTDGFYNITDLYGKVLLKGKLESLKTEINIKELTQGIYFINIHTDRHLATQKLIRE